MMGTQGRGIAVDTRAGRAIRNMLGSEAGDRERRIYALIRERFGRTWTNRKPVCGFYNCYGMVFASRRTIIEDDTQIDDILRDDGFRPERESEVRCGDLVLYRERKDRTLLHVAVVMRRDPTLGTMFALSKWNSFSGEDEHHIRHHCWLEDAYDIELEFWTDRP